MRSVGTPSVPVECWANLVDDATEQVARIAPRRKVLKGAKIVMDNWTNIDCQIRDVSETGAKLLCDSALNIPEEFRLVQLSENTIRGAKVVWRKSQSLGINFTSDAMTAPVRKY